jgi:hypothetical protein
MKRILAVLSVMLELSVVAGELKLVRNGENITLQNSFIKTSISAQGGKVILLQDRKNGQNYAMNKDAMGGLGKLRIYENLRNVELCNAKYKVTVVRNSPQEIRVRCNYKAENRRYKTYGFEFIKEYYLRKDDNRLGMDYMIMAHSQTGEFSPFIHNLIKLPAEKTYAFAQTGNGLFCKDASPVGDANNFVGNLKEPWGALISPASGKGIIEVNDPDKISEIFFWLGNEQNATVEPLFGKKKFAADALWKTTIYYVPVRGINSCHFAAAEYAGGFSSVNGAGVLNFFPAVDLGALELTVTLPDSKPVSRKISAKAGAPVQVNVPAFKGVQKLKVSVKGKNFSRTHYVYASTKVSNGSVKGRKAIYNRDGKNSSAKYAKCFLDSKCTYVSPDIVSFINVRLVNKLGQRKKASIVVEVPAGIELLAPLGYNAKYVDAQKQIIDGGKYVRYIVENCYRKVTFFAKTNLKPGTRGTIYYYAKWDGGQQEKQEIPVVSLKIAKAPVPKKLITNMGWMSARVHERWPEFHKTQKHVGINTVCSNNIDTNNLALVKKTAAIARKNGMFYATNYSPFGGFMRRDLAKHKDARAVSLYGKVSNQWICPSSRGEVFKNAIERSSRCGDAGVSMLWLDCEFWGGASYCFCPRCIKRFKQFMSSKHSELKYLDPVKFMKQSEKYPAYVKAWDEFIVLLGDEMYGAIDDDLKKRVKKSGLTSGPYQIGTYGAMPGKIYSHFFLLDSLLKKGILDIAQPSAYTAGDALRVADRIKEVRALTGKSNIVSWLSAGYDINSECRPEEFRYSLLENFLNGAGGFTLYTWSGCDAADMKEMGEAMRMVVPVEDIIVDGKVISGLTASNKKVKICGLEKGAEKLILLSEYFDSNDTPVNFNVTMDQAGKAVDMRTGKVICELRKGKNTVKTVIPANDRALLLYLGNRELKFAPERLNARAGCVQKKQTAEAKLSVPPVQGDKLRITETKSHIIFQNAFYKMSFNKRWKKFFEISFAGSGHTLKSTGLMTNFLQYQRGKVLMLPGRQDKHELIREKNGDVAILRICGSRKSNTFNADFVYEFKFTAGKPVVRIKVSLKQNPAVKWLLVRLNQWQPFVRRKKGDDGSNYLDRWAIAEPFRSGCFAEAKGTLNPANWRKGYRWIAAYNSKDAFGIIATGRQSPFIYVYNKDNYYMNGSYGGWDSKTREIDQYIYIGPNAGAGNPVGEWAAKVASER